MSRPVPRGAMGALRRNIDRGGRVTAGIAVGVGADVLATRISLLGIGIVVVVIVDVRNTRPRNRKRSPIFI